MIETGFQFLRPIWLIAVLPLAVLLWQIGKPNAGDSPWRKICDPALLDQLLITSDGHSGRALKWLIGIAWLLAVISLAGPTWSKQTAPVFQDLKAMVVVLDLSQSMNSQDIKPSRLARARFKIADLLTRREEGQTALIVFAGDAFVVSPLSDDTENLRAQLAVLEPGLMPVQGSKPELALEAAAELLRGAGAERGDILLFGDSSSIKASGIAETLNKEGYHTSVVGIGTAQGAPIPLQAGGFLKDGAGNIVSPKTDHQALSALAQSGGGYYSTITNNDSDLDRVLQDTSIQTGGLEQTDQLADSPLEQGPWLVLALIPLAALAFRRGWLVCIVLVSVTFSTPQQAWALEWKDLWQRPDQQAQQALEQEKFESAMKLAQDPALKGTAAYRSEQYEAAIESFAERDDATSHYNQGNALAKLQRFEEALSAYDKALNLEPDMEDAKANRAAVEEMLKQQEQSEQDQQSENKEDSESDEQGEKQDSENQQDGEQQSPENQESEEQQQSESEQVESEEEQQAAEEQARQEQSAEEEGEQSEQEKQAELAANEQNMSKEEKQAAEQWLRRIPDDPGGLLRRKFQYQYQRREGAQRQPDGQAW